MTSLPNLRKALKYTQGTLKNLLAKALIEYYEARGYRLLTVGRIKATLIITEGWIPPRPIPLKKIKLTWEKSTLPLPWRWKGLAEKLRKECGLVIIDNPVYRLIKVETDLNLTFTMGSYEEFIETCGALEWEVALAISQLEELPKDMQKLLLFIEDKLEFRSKINPLNLENRCAALGINTLTVIKEEGRAYMLIHHRGFRTAEGRGSLHVVPAGTFQPLDKHDRYHHLEFDLTWNIIREFAEELLGLKGSEKQNHIYKQLLKLKEILLSAGDLFFLGLTLDVMRLKPEILTLLILNSKQLETFDVKFNIKRGWEGTVEKILLNKKTLHTIIKNPRMLSAGKGCLMLSLPVLNNIL